MKQFKYRAKKSPNEVVVGTVLAGSQDEAVEKLNRMGILPIEIEETQVAVMSHEASSKKKAGRVKSHDLTLAYHQISRLVSSGIPILSAIGVTAEQSESKTLKVIFSAVQAGVREGYPVSSVLKAYPNVFSSFEIAMIQTGESVGRLDEVLSRIAEYRRQQDAIINKVKSAVAYPAFIFIVACGTIAFMLAYVIPKFSQFFLELGQDLPVATRLLIDISRFVQNGWYWMVLAVLAAYLVFNQAMKSKAKKISWDLFCLKIPQIGKLLLMQQMARFSRSLEIMLRSGVPLIKSVRIAVPVLDNEALKKELEKCGDALHEGGSLSAALRQSSIFPIYAIHLIRVGEESGKLDETLSDIAQWYEDETTRQVGLLTQMIEPAMILIVGLIMGLMIVAVLLPIFNINASIS